MARWIGFAFVAGVMLATWGVLAYLGYRRARTVRAIRARMASSDAGEPPRHAGWVAGAGALGAALGTAYAQTLAGVPLAITATWMILGFSTGALFFLAAHGDSTGVGKDARTVAMRTEGPRS